jgi:hypothetical protein
MKALLLITLFLSLPVSTEAAEIVGGKFYSSEGIIELQVRFAGGCKEHRFELQMKGCFESLPVKCTAQLVDLTTDDFCEAIVGQTIRLSTAQYGLQSEYYRGASIRILGDNGTAATVRLPN